MIKLATIGTGNIVENFLDSIKDASENMGFNKIEYVCAYSRDEEKAKEFAKKHGANRFETSLEKLAKADDIDGVYIASPNSLHYEQAILMLKNKKHVLCEKIIASNEKELVEMLKIAEENNVIILEAMRSIFDPAFEVIYNNLGKLGVIRRCSFNYCQYSSRYDKFKEGIVENAFNPEFSNGALTDIGIYCVYPMVHLFGMPDEIKSDAIILKDSDLKNSIDGAGTILFNYNSIYYKNNKNMQCEMIYSKISNSYTPSQIQGEEATMVIDHIANTKEINIYYNNKELEPEKIIIQKPRHNLIYEVIKWVELIETGERPILYNKSSLMSLKVVDEVRRQQGIVFPADYKNY